MQLGGTIGKEELSSIHSGVMSEIFVLMINSMMFSYDTSALGVTIFWNFRLF